MKYMRQETRGVDDGDEPLSGLDACVDGCTSRLSIIRTICLMLTLFVSLLFNLRWLLLESKRDVPNEEVNVWRMIAAQRSPYTGLGFDIQIPYSHQTEYTSPNQTHADQVWDELSTDPMVIAPTIEWARSKGLSDSWDFPWDPRRKIYFIKVFHQLHCLKVMRKSFHELWSQQRNTIPPGHIEHCLDSLRQDLMCKADDTPMPSLQLINGGGEGQLMQCKDFHKLVAWTQHPDRNACYKRLTDYKPIVHSIERYAFCPPGSEHFAAMTSYFKERGHYVDAFAE